MRLLTVEKFAPEAAGLREHFEARFSDPRKATGDRFVWDLWNVPGQYTALRTPAWQYFPQKLYEQFLQRLVWWGRRTLGCHDVSPPWLSCYVNGCEQRLHGDNPHGPIAFVFSLTKWTQRRFTGGETVLLTDRTLDFWRHHESQAGLEEPDVIELVEPRFNRLVAFDPRIPHGVRRVEGSMDPLEGRLVIHGWFVQPRPFIEGPLPVEALESAIGEVSGALTPLLESGLDVAGLLSFGFRVERNGSVAAVKLLADTTRALGEDPKASRKIVAVIRKALESHRFPKSRAASQVTLPMLFDR